MVQDNKDALTKDSVITCEHVTWVDSQGSGDWKRPPAKDDIDTLEVESVGFVIYEDKYVLLLAHSLDRNNGHICLDMIIPKCAIKIRNKLGTVTGDFYFYPADELIGFSRTPVAKAQRKNNKL